MATEPTKKIIVPIRRQMSTWSNQHERKWYSVSIQRETHQKLMALKLKTGRSISELVDIAAAHLVAENEDA